MPEAGLEAGGERWVCSLVEVGEGEDPDQGRGKEQGGESGESEIESVGFGGQLNVGGEGGEGLRVIPLIMGDYRGRKGFRTGQKSNHGPQNPMQPHFGTLPTTLQPP